jgi:hypothetical protein
MASLQRPTCEYGGIGGCNNPATRIVGFGDQDSAMYPPTALWGKRKWLFSCAKHTEYWRNRGGYWVTSLMGWCSDPARREELASYLDEFDDGSCVCGAPDRAKDHDCPARL